MRRRRAASNSPASLLRRFGSSTVARFVLIRSFPGLPGLYPFRPFSAALFPFSPDFIGLTASPLPTFWKSPQLLPDCDASDALEISKWLATPSPIDATLRKYHIWHRLAPFPSDSPAPSPGHPPPKRKTFAPSRKEHGFSTDPCGDCRPVSKGRSRALQQRTEYCVLT